MRALSKYFLSRMSALVMSGPLFLLLAGEPGVDNLTVFNSMAAAVSQKIVDRLSPDSSASILIRSLSQPQTGRWLIENGITKNLYERGLSQIYLDKYEATSTFVIEYQILSLGVSYHPTDKNDVIERRFRLSVAVRVSEGSSGRVKFFQEFNEQQGDRVAILEVPKFENKDYAFTQAELPEARGLKQYIEPFLVLTTTAAIIYLFFRLRSS